jgi:hypothetical protein
MPTDTIVKEASFSVFESEMLCRDNWAWIYSNDVLGLRYEGPSGWTVTAGSIDPANLDYRTPDGRPASQCFKILVSSHSPQNESGFNSIMDLFAIDPACFSNVKFPRSLNDRKSILTFSERITKSFSKTPYVSRKGADVGAVTLAGRLVVQLTGDDVINAGDERKLHVNTLLCVTESNGYWVAWAAVADDPTREQLTATNISFQVSTIPGNR